MQLFWLQGYEALGLTELLEHMDISRQSLYDTFGDKRSLFLETLDHYFRTRVGPMLAQLRAPGSPLENIHKMFALMEKSTQGDAFFGCLVGNTTAELAATDAEVAERLASFLGTVEDALHDTIRKAQELGEVSPEVDPRALAQVIVHASQGIALLSKVFRDRERARGVIASAMSMLKGA